MFPFIAKIGSVVIPSHAVVWFLAYTVAIIGFFHWARITGLNVDLLLNAALIGVVASIIGARLSAILMLSSGEQLRWYLDDPVRILKFWRGGMSYYGVVGAGFAVGAWFFLRHGPGLGRKVADLIIPWHALGHLIQSFGCLAAGCHFGGLTNLPWGISYSHSLFEGPRGFALHPFPVYLALLAVPGFVLSYAWVKIRYFESRSWLSLYRSTIGHFVRVRFVDGELLPLAGIYYSVGRFLIEFTRHPALQVWYPDWPLPQSQMACLLIFFLSLGGLLGLWGIDDHRKGRTGHDWWVKPLLKMIRGMEGAARRIPWKVR